MNQCGNIVKAYHINSNQIVTIYISNNEIATKQIKFIASTNFGKKTLTQSHKSHAVVVCWWCWSVWWYPFDLLLNGIVKMNGTHKRNRICIETTVINCTMYRNKMDSSLAVLFQLQSTPSSLLLWFWLLLLMRFWAENNKNWREKHRHTNQTTNPTMDSSPFAADHIKNNNG